MISARSVFPLSASGDSLRVHRMPAATALPIWKIHADILRTLESGNRLVLVAPTGSGKTTQVPQMLLDAGIAGEKMIVVLQPRRVAARLAGPQNRSASGNR